ncbi:benzoate 1,2-dioxygenase electron transfer component BenC [Nocardioides marmoraquaticus]
MSHQVALAFEDGVTRFITCEDDQTVADASYRARINIPLDCRDGACGTCKAVCESGEYDGGTYIDDALTADEAEDGFCLPCSMKPRSDLVLQIASTSAVAKTAAATHTTTVTGIGRLSPTTVKLSVAAPTGGKPLTYLPGQYVNIAVLGSDETRSYSFSSAPGADELDFLVKVIDGGLMSTWLTQAAAVGDEVSFTGPHGSFFLREAERPALLLAGGTGLAPILAILRKLVAEDSQRQAHLVYGVSTDDDLVELDTLADLAEQLPNLTWDHCVSDEASAAANKGYVMSLIGDEHLHGGDVAVYLCGPPPMVEAVRSHFGEQGVTPTGFYYEKFNPSSAAAPEPDADDEVDVEEPDAEPEVVETADQEDEPERDAAQAPVAVTTSSAGPTELREAGSSARSIAGQLVLGSREVAPLHQAARDDDRVATLRRIAGQVVLPVRIEGDAVDLDAPVGLVEAPAARAIAGQTVWPESSLEPLVARAPEPEPASGPVTSAGYEIGEEHPGVHESDAVFEARRALELGALELVLGTLTSQQLAGYRLLAETTLSYVEGDRFVDAAAYTETNAAFHDYLFTQTGNEHLLQAYQALGVKGQMAETLRNATWCDPRCATDHVEIVDAIEAQDRETARRLITEHAERSKVTMRRAMGETAARERPVFVSAGRFADQVVLLTGAAQGIGETTARRIAAEGGTLVLADRSDLVETLASELDDLEASGGASAVVADLETWEGGEDVVAKALAQHGRIDVAIHTVGGTIWAKPYVEYPPEQVEAEISRSLFPTLWGCRAVAPHMVERGSGTIVNVSSVATRGVHRVPYAAAKGGVNAITATLALELAPHGVRVVATAPGGTDAPPRRVPRGPAPESEQEQEWYQRIVDQTVESSLMKRYGTLDEQAAAICFLASREASYITGTTLPVAGGDLG